MSLTTPLYDLHINQKAKLVDFADHKLPIQYPEGIIKEALHTRTNASLFDIGHMGQVTVHESAKEQLAKLVPADLDSLNNYQHVYSFLLNQDGGILDDLIIARRDDHFYVVINGAVKANDFAHICKHVDKSAVASLDAESTLVAIQGPKAREILSSYDAEIGKLRFLNGGWFTLQGQKCYVSCSGYTGEDGFEMALPIAHAEAIVTHILENHAAAKMAGLGSRDILRLEAGLCLYGNDLNETITPVMAGLKWAIPKTRRNLSEAKQYLGANVIDAQFATAPATKRVGFLGEGKVPVRAGAILIDENDKEIGHITSGAFSPHLQQPLSMGYIEASFQLGDVVYAKVRDKKIALTISKMPFIKNNYVTA